MKEYIKSLVKESLAGILKEKSKTQTTDSDEKDTNKKTSATHKNLDQRDQVSIQNAFEKPLAPSYMDACKASGLISSHDELSNCIQKIKQKNGQGLTDKEKNALTKTLKDKM